MARVVTAVILISVGFYTGCGGECIRHSDCLHKEICVAGSCTIDIGDSGPGNATDSDKQNTKDAGTATVDSGQSNGNNEQDSSGPEDETDGGIQQEFDAGTE